STQYDAGAQDQRVGTRMLAHQAIKDRPLGWRECNRDGLWTGHRSTSAKHYRVDLGKSRQPDRISQPGMDFRKAVLVTVSRPGSDWQSIQPGCYTAYTGFAVQVVS